MVKNSTGAILFKEMLRAIKKDWKQLFSIIAISFLSICLFSGLTANAMNLRARADYVYNESNFADIYITTTLYDERDLLFVEDLEGVEKAEKRTYLTANHQNKKFNLIIQDDNNELSVPLSEDPHDFLLMEKFAKSQSVNIGDTFEFTFPNNLKQSSELPLSSLGAFVKEGKTDFLSADEIVLTPIVSGTMYHPEGVQSSQFSTALAYAKPDYVKTLLLTEISDNYDVARIDALLGLSGNSIGGIIDNLFLTDLNNQILVSATNSDTTLALIRDYYAKKDSNNLLFANKKESLASYQSLKQDVDQSLQLTFVFPMIFFLVSVLIISTTISQLIIKQRSVIGSLKATGVPKGRVYFHYMSYGITLSLIGGLIGFFVGPLIIPSVLNVKYTLLWDLPTRAIGFFHPLSIAMLLGLVAIATICSFVISYSVIKERPVLTLRPRAPKVKKKAVNGDSKLYQKCPLTLKMAGRNILRNKGKTLMVVLGTMGCTALLVCGFGIIDTLDYDVHRDFYQNLSIDLTLTPKTASESVKDYVLSLEGVERCEEIRTYPTTVSKDSYFDVELTIVEDNSSYFVPECESGYFTIDQETAKKLNAGVGDIISITINNELIAKPVKEVFTTSLLHGVYAVASDFSNTSIPVSSYEVKTSDDTDIGEIKSKLLESDYFSKVATINDTLEAADDMLSSIKIMTNVIKVFAVLLSVAVIYNLTSLNLSERSRDIATMKVLGFSFKEMSTTLTSELMIDTFVGSVLGLILGYPMTVLVLVVNRTDLVSFIYHINWYSYLIAFLISFVTAFVVSYLLNFKIKHINMAESLKSVE